MSPPGLDGSLVEIDCGGDTNWLPFTARKIYTNVFIVKDGKILLGYKKRGFGRSLYNGFGGKVEPGESTHAAALRELEEEAGIQAPLDHCGTLLFLTQSIEWAFQIEIYRAETYTGELIETDEMRPQWFLLPINKNTQDTRKSDGSCPSLPHIFPPASGSDVLPIPFDEMWEGDRHWIPLVIANQHFVGREDFEMMDGVERLRRWWFGAPVSG